VTNVTLPPPLHILGISKRENKEWISSQTMEYIKKWIEKKNFINHTKSERQKDKLKKEYVDLNKIVKKSARTDMRKFMETGRNGRKGCQIT
jgi:TPP-dependent pyruvate/acetoin dehydrogenase alpha subunit